MINLTGNKDPNFKHLIENLELIASRLERLSVDSTYAHRASGYRGNILRYLDRLRIEPDLISQIELENMRQLTDQAFRILIAAAREIARS